MTIKRMVGGAGILILVTGMWMSGVAQAQDKDKAKSVVPMVTAHKQKAFGTVGNVEYVEFKQKGESTILIKNNKGEQTSVSLQDIQPGSKILATYRKVTDEQGKEKNVVISLSVIQAASEDGPASK